MTANFCIRSLAAIATACSSVAWAGEAVINIPSPPASDYVPDPASIIREGTGYRYTQSGWIVVHIEGAPYERGYQHGKLLAAEIADHIESLAKGRSPKSSSEGWRDARTLANALFLRKYEAEYLEEMKGIADGAAAAGAKFDSRPLDLLDIVTVNSNIEIEMLDAGLEATPTGLEGVKFRDPPEGQIEAEQEEHCSAFAATGPATSDGQIVFGHITMFSLYAVRHFNVWLDIKPKAGHRLVMQAFPGAILSGLDYYMNDAGLLCSETTITQTNYQVDGTPLASRIRRVMQYADSIDKAVEILVAGNNGLYSNEWLLGDIKTNEVAMFELGTHKHKLWRSSKREYPGGTEGFYWGNNNTKDLEVRKETIPSLSAKPANLTFYPKDRDVVWQRLFREHQGKIDVPFGFKAFTTPPLAAFSSCDAKFTTTALAKEMKSWALFGPPLGRTWDATPEELRRLPDTQALVSNDWALVHVASPAAAPAALAKAVDLKPFPKAEKEEPSSALFSRKPKPKILPPAWRGTILNESDGDIWLAAAFADYERIVSLERSLKQRRKGGKLSKDDQDRLALAQFAPLSRWQTAVKRLGHDLPLAEVHPRWDTNEWYAIASGKGVMLMSTLRAHVGGEVFDKALDEFGREHAGQPVSTAQFREHLEKAAGHSLASLFEPWLSGNASGSTASENFWAITSFEIEPEKAIIVYGTTQDKAAQRDAAEILQRKIVRRFYNLSVPIRSDTEVTEEELKNNHVLLVGRPSANGVTARMVEPLAVRFGPESFVVRGDTYAHADSAVIVSGDNRLNDRYSVVVFAGLGARATRHCVENIPRGSGDATEIVVIPNGQPAKPLRVTASPITTAMP